VRALAFPENNLFTAPFLEPQLASRMILPTMSDSDSDKRPQLAQVYAGMTEDELRSLAGEAWSLTKIGKELLKVELARRGVGIELSESLAEDANVNGLVTLSRFRDLPDAELAKSFLESTGIECFLRDDLRAV
jgi:hypothetical protein